MIIEQLYSLYLRAQSVSTDSRNVPMKSLFFALKGDNFNGNEFARQAIESGAAFAIVDEKEYEDEANDIYYVEDSLNALQKLAQYHREKLAIPVLTLTGSNGKTTTKELITAVLNKKYNTASTKGNLNNHIGVPLTLLSIHPNYEIAVVEMGANHQREIEFLCGIAQPDFGYITNFGKAHLEGFGGEEGVIKGKSELYEYLRKNKKTAIVNCDDKKQVELTEDVRRISFGTGENAEFRFRYRKTTDGNCDEIIYDSTSILCNLVGEYNTGNVAAAIAVGLKFEVPIEDIKSAIEEYKSENNRSQIVELKNYKIILDAYNANPTSMEAALLNFSKFKEDKAIILGDMFELGEESSKEHQQIAELALKLNFKNIYLIGEMFGKTRLNENENLNIFPKRNDAAEFFQQNPIAEKLILIKGSRGMALEKLLEAFQ